jgi:hypothetical protein
MKIIAGFALFLSSVAFAGNYVIGVENINYYPHYNFNKPLAEQGFTRALFDAFAEDSGHTFTYEARPVVRLLNDLIEGNVDFKYPDNAFWGGDAKKGKDIVYSDNVVKYIDGTSTVDSSVTVKSLTTVRGFTPWDYLSDIESGKIKLSEQNDMSQLVKFVIAGRADAAYANIDIVRYTLNSMNMDGKLIFREDLPHSEGYYHLSTISYPKLITEFNEWQAENVDRITDIKSKFGLESF